MHLTKIFFVIISVFFVAGCCSESSFPGVGVPGVTFYSKDESEVEVKFSRCTLGSPSGCVQLIKAIFKIPRAYIITALPYEKREYCTVPDQVFVHDVTLGISYPDGVAVPLGPNPDNKGDQARLNNMWADVAFVTNEEGSPEPYSEFLERVLSSAQRTSSPDGGNWEHLERYRGRGYLGDAGEGIYDIYCASDIERAKEIHYCNYYSIIADGISVRARFVDFRLHGGLEFAQERMRLIRKTICRFGDCKINGN